MKQNNEIAKYPIKRENGGKQLLWTLPNVFGDVVI